jgi:hypothetical protein
MQRRTRADFADEDSQTSHVDACQASKRSNTAHLDRRQPCGAERKMESKGDTSKHHFNDQWVTFEEFNGVSIEGAGCMSKGHTKGGNLSVELTQPRGLLDYKFNNESNTFNILE